MNFKNQETLRQHLLNLDGRGYKAYKDIQGTYDFGDFILRIDYVQSDPYAAPSKLRVQVPQKIANFAPNLYQIRSREIALRDCLTRQFAEASRAIAARRGSGKSGLIAIASGGQEVLQRTSVFINHEWVEVRFVAGLPAGGRRILGHQAAEMLCDDLPQIVHQSLKYSSLNPTEIDRYISVIEDADFLRSQLRDRGLVAFIADGAILPRRSGVDPRQAKNAIAFESPPELRVQLECPNQGKITGMGIPAGVTLIVGGGYHGKSTLLKAIALGVYNRIPGDGREFVVTDPSAVKIRAEDGRSVVGVDISPFINQLPNGESTEEFSTTNASGSTSQAANIMEALEAGSQLLLIDEDTAATNLMIRDRRMQALISKAKEPITPFIDQVRSLYTEKGVSTILVMGGSGDYFDVADTVIAMENFRPADVTEKARAIAQQYATGRTPEGGGHFSTPKPRIPQPQSLDPSRGKREIRLKVRDVDEVVFGTEDIDLSAVEQLVDPGQLRAIAHAMVYARRRYLNHQRSLVEILDCILLDLETEGLDLLTDYPQGDLVLFRRFELAAAINRLRSLIIQAKN